MGMPAQGSNVDTHTQDSLFLSISITILISLSISQDFPLIFHGVSGINEREDQCPSFFNMAEVEVLIDYLKALINHFHKNNRKEIKPKEIGIIAPYRKQVSISLQ